MEDIIYHVDNTIVSLKKVHIEGWAVSTKGRSLKYTFRKKSRVTIVDRPDVNRCHDFVKKEEKTGFIIEITSLGKEIITISDGTVSTNIEINCFDLKKQYIYQGMKKTIDKIKEIGLINTIKLIANRLLHKQQNLDGLEYMEWRKKHIPSEVDLEKQKKHRFKYSPLISIVVPTYNTPFNFLTEMIESVLSQTYTKWELCIADGASTKSETKAVLNKYAKKYSNIKVKYLDENKMISANTNEALKLAEGDYVGLFDHDDLLEPNALFEMVKMLNEKRYDMIYSDEDKVDSKGKEFFEPHFKPDFSKYTLRSYNYITHFTLINKKILDEVGPFDSNCDGAQDFDMFLRISDKTNNIGHIPMVLYHWRVHNQSTAATADAKSYVTDAGKLALRKHLERNGIKGEVTDGLFPTSYKINYEIKGNPLVSIIIPNKDHIDDLDKCISSIRDKTDYENYEIIIVENNSEEEKTFNYYKQIEKDENIRVLYWKSEFNYSAINNFGVKEAKGEYILLLNNDVEIINKEWLSEMLMLAQQEDVGCVGAILYFDDDTIQHAGIILGIGSVAGHSHKYYPKDSFGYVGRLKVVQNLSAVTAACLLVKKKIFNEVEGLDETFKVAFNDVDFCMKVGKNYQNIFTPYAELYHYESKSRGLEDSKEKIERFNGEIKRFGEKWGLWIEDPYYNKNLSITKEDFSLR